MPALSSTAKTILITVDGVNQDVLCELVKNNSLPFFKQLLADKTLHPVISTFAASEPVDILYGTSSAVHGFYAQQQLKSGKYHFTNAHPSEQNNIPFTNYLAENGFKSLLIDVPFAELTNKANETTILNSHTAAQTLTEGASLQNVKKILSHKLVSSDSHPIDGQVAGGSLAAKIKFTKLALTEHTWDLAYLDLGDSWLKCATSDDNECSNLNDSGINKQLYQLLDRALAEITQHLSSDDNIILVSRSKSDELPQQQFIEPVLCQLGLLKLNDTVVRNIDECCLAEAASSGLKHRLKGLLWSIRSRLNRLFTPSRILWEETRAFQLPGDRNSYLRINLLGREPQGIVTPGVEYDGLLLGIAAELNDLRVEPGGEKAIKNISFPRRDMAGPYHDTLPDIAIEWNQELLIHGLHSSSVCLSTEHDIDQSRHLTASGFMLVSGKNIQPVPQHAEIDFRSIASTVLALFHLDQPQSYQLPSLVKVHHAPTKQLQKVAS